MRAEVGIDELKSIFESFGAISSCSYTGESYSVMSILGMAAQVKTAVIEFETSQSAKDSIALHNSNIAGVLLTVELSTSSLSTSVPTSTSNKSIDSSLSQKTQVKLENMVKSADEVFEEDFKEEIADEASNYGTLESIPVTVTIDDIDVTNDTLDSYNNNVSKNIGSSPKVLVYLHYKEASSANKAQSAMNGRFFAGLTIKATLI